jgi:cyanate lyase
MHLAILFIFLVGMAGCTQPQWSKADGTALTLEDEQACKEQAYRKAGGQMNADPFVYREDMYACLQEKGYQLKKG